MDDLDLAGLGPDDPLRSVLDGLQQELVVPPDADTRSAHLAAMSTTIPGASGWALRFRRGRIRQALVGAGLQVALVSTAAAAGIGALAVPGDLLPPSIQRVVAAAGSVLGLDLPSPDDTTAEVEETEEDGPLEDATETPSDPGSEEPAVTGTEEPSSPPTTDDEPGDDQGEDRDADDDRDERSDDDEKDDESDDEKDDESDESDESDDEKDDESDESDESDDD